MDADRILKNHRACVTAIEAGVINHVIDTDDLGVEQIVGAIEKLLT